MGKPIENDSLAAWTAHWEVITNLEQRLLKSDDDLEKSRIAFLLMSLRKKKISLKFEVNTSIKDIKKPSVGLVRA